MKQKHSVILISLLILLLIGCAKNFLWQGQYISIMTKDTPKEDFKVDKYIVISYADIEHKKNPSTLLYQFVIIENGQQTRLISLDNHPRFGMFLEETGTRGHRTYNFYTTVPTYTQVKDKIIEILSEKMP
ncbi:MAG: hypothetical protein Q7U87_04755 [bacterium]|nr:hypothetical protein [bacterium]